jgi:hypothetical protein
MDILELLTKPEIVGLIGGLLLLILPKELWRYIPIIRALLKVFEAAYTSYESRAKAEVIQAAAKAAEEAVKGTEQLIASGQLTKEAAKAQAMSFLMSNFKLDQGTAELLVERAVRQLKQ